MANASAFYLAATVGVLLSGLHSCDVICDHCETDWDAPHRNAIWYYKFAYDKAIIFTYISAVISIIRNPINTHGPTKTNKLKTIDGNHSYTYIVYSISTELHILSYASRDRETQLKSKQVINDDDQ